jgi:anthrone oxygenase-like protein
MSIRINMTNLDWKGNLMFAMTISFANLLLASLATGAMFGVWLFFNPKGLDGPRYVVLHQQGIRTMNTAMPIMGAVTIALTVAAAAMARHDGVRLSLLAMAVIGFLAAGLITRFCNQPINTVVMSWSAATPPTLWMQLRDKWWHWHVTRLVFGIGGLCALILANLTDARL